MSDLWRGIAFGECFLLGYMVGLWIDRERHRKALAKCVHDSHEVINRLKAEGDQRWRELRKLLGEIDPKREGRQAVLKPSEVVVTLWKRR